MNCAKSFMLCLGMVLSLSLTAAVPLAVNGESVSSIKIDTDSDKVMKFAAQELAHWIGEISGGKPAVSKEKANTQTQLVLSVSKEVLAMFPEDAKKLQGNDGYAVRTKGNTVYIFGSCSKGVLNGVFRLLYKNSDIIWARPQPFGTVFTKNPDFALTQTDYMDIPVFKSRGWQHWPDKNTDTWDVRHGLNWSHSAMHVGTSVISAKDYSNGEKYGFESRFGGGHNLVHLYLPENIYGKTNPEFYPLLKGKRQGKVDATLTQLCFTNSTMTREFIRRMDEFLAKNPQCRFVNIMPEDNLFQCECEKCKAPIVLENGTKLEFGSKVFASTRIFIWLNEVARHVAKKYPDKMVGTLAYMLTETPPAVKVEPNIEVSFCPYYKDFKRSTLAPGNENTLKNFNEWAKKSANICWRDYYGYAEEYPRALDTFALEELKYANQKGSVSTHSEIRWDAKPTLGAWDANAMYFWVVTEGMWNPYQEAKALRNEYLKRTYGAAAPEMKEYFELFETGWLKSAGRSTADTDSALGEWKKAVFDRGLEAKCRELLTAAAQKALHPNSKKMIQAVRSNFDKYAELAGNGIKVPRCVQKPEFDPEFAGGDWAKAQAISDFTVNGAEKSAPEKTVVKILHDGQNYYIGIRAFHRNPEKMHVPGVKPERKTKVEGEGIEIFIAGKWFQYGGYVTLFADISGNSYQNFNANPAWKDKWDYEVKTLKDGYSIMVTVPFKGKSTRIWSDKNAAIMVVRQFNKKYHPDAAPSPDWRMKGTTRHKVASFRKMILE